eukprot:EG_transcript_9621
MVDGQGGTEDVGVKAGLYGEAGPTARHAPSDAKHACGATRLGGTATQYLLRPGKPISYGTLYRWFLPFLKEDRLPPHVSGGRECNMCACVLCCVCVCTIVGAV